MKPILLMPTRYVAVLVDLLEKWGLDPATVLEPARVSAASLAAPHGCLTAQQLEALLIEARRRTGRDDLGLDLGWRIPSTAHEMLGLALISARMVDASIRLVARYYPLISGLYTMRYERQPDRGVVTFAPNLPLRTDTRQIHVDILVASFHAQFSRQMRARIAPYDIRIGLAAPRHRQRYAELRPARVTFDPYLPDVVRIEIDARELDRPLPMANAQTARVAERQCRAQLAALTGRHRWRDWVADAIQALDNQQPTLEGTAAACNCSPRTLDRRLAREGTSFRAVAAEVRIGRIKELLAEEDLPISEIAYRLGYGDAANLTRAFRKITGEAPSVFRRRATAGR
ncbi:MAG TPA: AraC family transcriptional regulator ligand-binding domain-containing protein [Aliidongia sp.]|nr:AraC family transcriptional regulator ligand-binding domain-containing protein [Aliidongia sp.]